MIFAVILQFVVCFFIMKWVLKQKPGEKYSKKTVAKFFVIGALTTIPALILADILSLGKDTFWGLNPFVAGFLTALVSAALLEEIAKYIFFRIAMIKKQEMTCWLDVIIAAIVFGIGFALIEDISYAIFGDGNILRAILPMHILFQLIMGYYYGKALVTKQFKYHVLSLAAPILCHTIFDMFPLSMKALLKDMDQDVFKSLSNEELMKLPYLNELFVMVAGFIVVAIASVVLLVIMIRKIGVWSRNGEKQEAI